MNCFRCGIAEVHTCIVRGMPGPSKLEAVSISAASLCGISQRVGYPGGEDFPERKSFSLFRLFVAVANELLVHGELIIIQHCLAWGVALLYVSVAVQCKIERWRT